MSFKPTEEQEAILDAFEDGEHLIVQAGAGAGKTTTLREMALTATGYRGTYMAFNRSVADEARQTFPRGVQAKTAHQLAWRFMKEHSAETRDLMNKTNGSNKFVPLERVSTLAFGYGTPQVDYSGGLLGDDKVLDHLALALLAKQTLSNWCKSADDEPTINHLHIPRDWRVSNVRELKRDVWKVIAKGVENLHNDTFSPRGKIMPFSFEHYLKFWQLQKPNLRTDYLMLDEAQDASPVIADVFLHQAKFDTQIVAVGDSNQAIYGFTGAIDALAKMKESGIPYTELFLTESFRFGPVVADAANGLLAQLNSPIRVTGLGGPSELATPRYSLEAPSVPNLKGVDAVLVRTNAQGIEVALKAITDDLKPFVRVDTKAMKEFFIAARTLMEGTRVSHPDLEGFRSWAAFERFVENDEVAQAEFQVLITLTKKHQIDDLVNIFEIIDEIEEQEADVVISTAHKAKGLEWDNVVLYGFNDSDSDAEQMLSYVAVTRARRLLDPGELWPITHYGFPAAGESVAHHSVQDYVTILDESELTPEEEAVRILSILNVIQVTPGQSGESDPRRIVDIDRATQMFRDVYRARVTQTLDRAGVEFTEDYVTGTAGHIIRKYCGMTMVVLPGMVEWALNPEFFDQKTCTVINAPAATAALEDLRSKYASLVTKREADSREARDAAAVEDLLRDA